MTATRQNICRSDLADLRYAATAICILYLWSQGKFQLNPKRYCSKVFSGVKTVP